MRYLFFTLLAMLCCTGTSVAENKNYPTAQDHPTLSIADSIACKRYLDSADNSLLFSIRRQLYLDSALQIAPWRAGLWQQKSMPLLKQRKYELAMPYLDSAVKYNEHKYLDYRAFIKCIFAKSYKDAIADFNAARALLGNSGVMDHSYDFYIGMCYLQLNNFDSCSHLMQKCIDEQTRKNGPSWVHPMNWFYLGIAQQEQLQYEKAISSFDSCLKLYPNFCDAKYYKADCLVKTGRLTEAKPVMEQALADFRNGYTINEDNAIYELYPYQVVKAFIEGYAQYLQTAPSTK